MFADSSGGFLCFGGVSCPARLPKAPAASVCGEEVMMSVRWTDVLEWELSEMESSSGRVVGLRGG